MSQSSVRLTKQNDLHTLATVYVELYEYLNMGEQWNLASAEKLLVYYFGKFPELAYTAEYDGKIVGAFLAGVKPWWDGTHLFDGEIFVHHHFQKHGLGRSLLKAVFAAAKKHYQAVSWDFFTFTGKGSPIVWYQKIGITVPDNYALMGGDLDSALRAMNLPAARPRGIKQHPPSL